MTSQLTIALDYDGTYDEDPDLWDFFIEKCLKRQHDICLITFRDDRYDKTPLLLKLEKKIPVYYTRGVAKRWWADQFGPGKVDIWIDDRPEAIINNSMFSASELQIWRVADNLAHYPV